MMSPDPGTLSLGAAFVAGLAASGHCIGMCGGIAGALAMRSPQGSTGTKVALALAYNLSRITSYAIAGATSTRASWTPWKKFTLIGWANRSSGSPTTPSGASSGARRSPICATSSRWRHPSRSTM